MHRVHRIIEAGRIGRTRSFVAAIGLAVLVLPVVTALAFFAATGTGQVPNVQAGSPSSTVALSQITALTYAGPSTTNLQPGGTVSFTVGANCTAGCPAYVSTVNLGSWTSDTTGCDATDMPGSFTMPTITANLSNVPTTTTTIGTAVITWVNLGISQNVCSGAKFTFVLTTP